MLVQQIMEFIKELEQFSGLAEFDKSFLENIKNRFFCQKEQEVISESDFDYLKDILYQRWIIIFDKDDDYTYNPKSRANRHWIKLAISLANQYGISPRQLLIPVLRCYEVDLKNAETEDLGLWFLFLNENNSSFVSILSLYSQIKVNAFDIPAFSLRELLRIKSKRGDFRFISEGSSYDSFWNYLVRNVMPTWHLSGSLPVFLLPPLLELVDIYFLESKKMVDSGSFRKHLLSWSLYIQSCSKHDLNNLYGQRINVGQKTVFLVEILLNCLKTESKEYYSLNNEIISIARWLSDFDASFVCHATELDGLYEELYVGRYFDVFQLKKYLTMLCQTCTGDMSQSIEMLIDSLSNKAEIDAFTIESLEILYQKRWINIENTALDYRRSKQSVNEPWVRLAQLLSPNYLESNYFLFLMPTVCQQSLIDGLLNQSHNTPSYFVFAGKLYDNFSNNYGFLFGSSKPIWGEYPRPLMPLLLELIDLYFQNEKNENHIIIMRKNLINWIVQLERDFIEDINFLYSRSVLVAGEAYYFRDVLLSLLINSSFDLTDEMVGLARFLCEYDASYIVNCSALSDLYNELHVGPAFGIKDLRSKINYLITDCSSVILCRQFHLLIEMMSNVSIIDEAVIELVLKLFELRWLEMDNEPYRIDLKWVRLAQALSGAKYITSNYYRVLMPTTPDFDSITGEPLTNYGLNHYIFSKKTLILLDNVAAKYRSDQRYDYESFMQFKEARFLYNCNVVPPKPFSATERNSLQHASKKFHKYVKLTYSAEEIDEAIELSTVNALSRLVDLSLYPSGLASVMDIFSKKELDSIDGAYYQFQLFYEQLPEDERQRLNDQIICYRDVYKSFKKVLLDVERQECAAVAGQYILQLVIDYLPERRFKSTIEKGIEFAFMGRRELATVGIHKMRANSRKKQLRDVQSFERYTQLLIVSILTHSFDYLWFESSSVSVLDCSNLVINIAKRLFYKLMAMLDSGDYSNYPDIVYTEVNLALSDSGLITGIRSLKTRSWLESIADHSFSGEDMFFYEPEQLLSVILPLTKGDFSLKSQLEEFLDELVRTCAQESENYLLNKIRVNIKFIQLIRSFAEEPRVNILNRLERSKGQLYESNEFKELCTEFLMQRMAALGSAGFQRQSHLFFKSPQITKTSLPKEIISSSSIIQIIDSLLRMVEIYRLPVRDRLTEYLQRMKSPIIPVSLDKNYGLAASSLL